MENIKVEQFIQKHGIRFDCHRVEKRPDGLMDGDYGKEPLATVLARDKMRHFKCRIWNAEARAYDIAGRKVPVKLRSFGLYFSQGSGHTVDPTLADVLDCLASDASGHDNANSFEDWASDYGYDTDSRKAEKTWRAIQRSSEQLKRTLGESAYEELLWETERL